MPLATLRSWLYSAVLNSDHHFRVDMLSNRGKSHREPISTNRETRRPPRCPRPERQKYYTRKDVFEIFKKSPWWAMMTNKFSSA